MDVDNSDIDLISQFRTMNTNDKDHLIAEFKRLSNTQLTNEGCCFFLDLAEWNLNTALWAYYEYDAPADGFNNMPQMKFLCDITIGEGESVAPNTKFIKTWRIKNAGVKKWPYGCQLKLVNTNLNRTQFSNESSSPTVHVNALEPEETVDVSIELQSPEQCGIYQSQYRLFTPTNAPFGDPIWLVLNVEAGGVLGITQQLNNVSMFGTSSNNNNISSTSHFKSNIFNLSTLNTTNNNKNNNILSNTNVNNLAITTTNPNILPTQSNETFKNLTKQNEETNSNNNNATSLNLNQILDEEKRPDFYDDMFS